MKSNTEEQLLEALQRVESAVQTLRTAQPKPDLRALFARIDELTAQLPRETNPDLLHYLQRKSYEKARAWLEGRRADIAAGNCGR